MLKALYLVLVSFVIFACSQGVVDDKKESGTPMAQEQTATEQPAGDPHGITVPKEKRVSIPKEIVDKFKSVIIGVKNEKQGIDVQTEVLIGQKSEIQGTPFTILVEHYLPEFVIDGEGVYTTRSGEENNPAVKIKVFEGEQEIFDGMLYKNFPDMHGSFAHPDYVLTLIKSVVK
jgi:hypothetical protein